jgi:pimeloyl-ACP methyl ester carboxylesterase
LPYITSDGINLFLDIAGSGTPVVFVHGLGLDHRQWDPQWADLAPAFQTVRIDMRGHGRSASALGGAARTARARDLQRVLVQIGMDRLNPGFVVAHAHAADAALQAALDEPRALRGVVVVSPAVGGHEWSAEWQELWRGVGAEARAGRVGAALERWRGDTTFARVRALPAAWAAIEAMHAGCNGAQLADDAADATPTTLERLAECRVPILVVVGRHDRADFRRAATAIAAAAPKVEVCEADAGHFPNLEQPLEFTRWLREFVARNS